PLPRRIVGHALAPDRHEAQVETQLVDGAYIFDGEDVVGRFEQGGGILVCYGGEGALARGGEGDAAFELVSERGGEVRSQQGFGRALQRLCLAALAAEAEAVHDAERGQQ